jgi:hypothetical protein
MRRSLLVLATALTLLAAGPVAAQAYWGAIAVDTKSGAYGVAYEFKSPKAAQAWAKHECGERRCKVAAWVRNGFAALVLTKSGKYYAGIGRSERIARQKAREHAHDPSASYVTSVFSGYS